MNLSERDNVKVGLLFSLTGTTGITERGQYRAVLLAIKQVNERGGIHGKRLLPIVEDIASDPFIAAKKAEKLILTDRVAAIIGLYTSVCRKMVLPIVEKYDTLLFYPTQYEGEEQSPNVFYCGPLPNQQLLHFIPWITGHLGKSFYLIGSDYIYPRETNRHIKHLVEAHHGLIVGESYTFLGNREFHPYLQKINEAKPDVVFSTLVGESAIEFYKQYRQFGLEQPITSSITAETEVQAMDAKYAAGHYSCFPYFHSISSEKNQTFIREYQCSYGTEVISSAMENAYNSVFLLAEALSKTKEINTGTLRKRLSNITFEAPQGTIRVDENNQHLWLNTRIGQVDPSGQFNILWGSKDALKPIPFFEKSYATEATSEIKGHVLSEEQLANKRKKHASLLEQLKRSVDFLPCTFALFDDEGILLEVCVRQNTSDTKSPPLLKPGTSWLSPPLRQSGIGLALTGHTAAVVCGSEHECKELEDWQSVGIPVQGPTGTLRGVLGLFKPMTAGEEPINRAESLDFMIGSLSQITKSSVEIMEQTERVQCFNRLLHEITCTIPESLFVMQGNAIFFHNDSAAELLRDDGDSIHSMLKDISMQEPVERELLRRKKISDDLFEVRVPPSDQHRFIYLKPLGRKKANIAVTKNKQQLLSKDIIGSNERFLRTVQLVKPAAKVDASVLILGESGTGKELFARAIHNESERRDKPFVALNCAAMPKDLINAELFGYVEGAFTGAKKGGNAGKFEAANGGTLFLDEIGDMPLELQATLLRVLQEKEVTRVGGHKPIPVDVRIIAATNRKLNQEIAFKGSFRSDLFYRLNVFTIELIPLRERSDDIPELASYFMNGLNESSGLPRKSLPDDVLHALSQYSWPGNIRELQNVIEQAFYLSGNAATITIDHLPDHLVHTSEHRHRVNDRNDPTPGDHATSENNTGTGYNTQPKYSVDADNGDGSAHRKDTAQENDPSNTSDTNPTFSQADEDNPLPEDLQHLKMQHIKQWSKQKERIQLTETLLKFHGNISKTAKHLGISRTTLYRRLEEYDLR